MTSTTSQPPTPSRPLAATAGASLDIGDVRSLPGPASSRRPAPSEDRPCPQAQVGYRKGGCDDDGPPSPGPQVQGDDDGDDQEDPP